MNDLAVGARPQDVIPGIPEEVEALAARLAVYADQAGEAAARLRAIDAGAWVGEAGDAFREAIGELPAKLQRGCDAFWDAVYALRVYAATLREAQATATRAIEIFTEADRQTTAWAAQAAAHEQARVSSVYGTRLPEPAPALDDPGEHLRQEARHLVEQAGEEVEAAARRSAARLKEAGDAAPNKPGFFRRAVSAVGDFGRGAVEGTVGMATFAFKLSPTYALVDPNGYVENLAGMGKGLVYGVTHPVEFAKAVTNWDMWLDNPARALGQLVPELALALATAGAGGAAKGAGAARRIARSGDEVASVGRAATRSADELAQLRRLAGHKADELIAAATKAEKRVTPVLDEIARGEGAELVGLEHRLKKANSLTDKITRDAAREHAHLPVDEAATRTADGVKDVLRYTVQSDRSRYAETYDAVSAKLKDRGFTLDKVKNTWAEPGSPQAGPYRGINSQWRTPDGQPFELQFHTPESFATKQETHAMYEELRNPETPIARQQELLEIMTRMSDQIPVPPGAVG